MDKLIFFEKEYMAETTLGEIRADVANHPDKKDYIREKRKTGWTDVYSGMILGFDVYASILGNSKNTIEQNVLNRICGHARAYKDRTKIAQYTEMLRHIRVFERNIEDNWTLKKLFEEIDHWDLWTNKMYWTDNEYADRMKRKMEMMAISKIPEETVSGEQTQSTDREQNEMKMTIKERLMDLIVHGGCKQIILTGAPGTGKTFIAKELAKEDCFGELEGKKFKLVQFHPSYDYTDFVEGLRPIETDGGVTFKKLDGIFKKFCRDVETKGNPEKLYLFVIDEINRANLSKVFGELMFGLEKDKRGAANKFDTQYSNLPTYFVEEKCEEPEKDIFAKGFYIPENVVVIGTMNDIDRSVDSMDFALRRRFEWLEVEVTEHLLSDAFASGSFGQVIQKEAVALAEHIVEFNALIIRGKGKEYGLNRQYDISQGQFAGIPEKETMQEILDYVWDYRVESLIREYLRGEEDMESFIMDAKDIFLSYGK